MKKIFTLIAALTLSAGLWATSIWSGSQDIHWDNSLTIDASKFASALPGNKLTLTLTVNDGTNDAIEFKANGQKLPGTRFSICQDWWETYDLFMTQDMIDSCKVYGMEICGENFEVTNIDLSEGKAANMKEGKVIWTGYFWVDSWNTLEVFKEALTAVKDWSKYSAMRFYSECPTTDNLIYLLADLSEAGVIAKSEPDTDETAETNPLKRYEGYAELDLTQVDPLTVINALSSDRLMIQMDKQGSAAFNFTDVVLVEQTAPVEYKYTEYENWQIKYGNTWEWSDNMEKVEDGLFKLEVLWEGTGFNVKSDENPIKKDWFAPEELVLGEEVIAPVTVDVYLQVIDDETVKIGVGVIPVTDPVWPEDAPTTAPAAPTVDGASILGAAITTSYAFEPQDWPGAMPQLLTFETGETIYYMERMTWQIYTNWDEDSYDVSKYNMLHVDLYPATGTEIKIAFEGLSVDDGGQGYKNSVVKTLTAGQWNALDIALSEFPALTSGDPYDFSDIRYFILEGYNAEQSALTVGNVYFYSNPTALPKVDETGITVNGRKYGFPVRLVTEVK